MAPLIRVLRHPFDPWKIQPVEHALARHPLLQLESLIDLGKRLESNGRVRTHSDQATAETPFNAAPGMHPNRKSVVASLADVANAGAWMSPLNIQTDPTYRRLVDEVLDDVRPTVEAVDPGMTYRAGWIFVTSPRAVTPFHMDKEHNFIVQIHGKKRVYVWDPFDRDVISERAQELFHSYHSRELVQFKEEFRERAFVFDMEPGMGAYMPSTAPHMVENGDGPSITASFTFYTAATRRRHLLYRGKNHLRRLGVAPAPVGQSAPHDELLHAAMRGLVAMKDAAKRALGREVRPTTARYAFHVFS